MPASRLPFCLPRAAGAAGMAVLIVGALWWAGLPDALTGVHLAAVSLICALWLGSRSGRRDAVAVLAAAAAIHGRVVFTSVWDGQVTSFGFLWLRLAEVALVGLIVAHAHPAARELRALAMVLLVGIPTQPAGQVWASFPLVCLLIAGSPGSLGRWSWVLPGWAALEIIRAPCRFDAVLVLSVIALFMAGLEHGRTLSRAEAWLAALGSVLLVPMLGGLGWAAAMHISPTHLSWGVNVNPLAAQSALGGLLLFLGLRRCRPVLAWAAVASGAAMGLALRSIWPCACLLPVAAVSALPPSRWRTAVVYIMATTPLLTPLAAFVTPRWIPPGLLISYLSRQYHWYAALRFVAAHPWGGGLGSVHPQALGMAVPPPELAVIPGIQMQHAHHALLHTAEQGGVIVLVVAAVLGWRWILRFTRSMERMPAGFGLLFLWLHNGADLSLSYEPLVLTAGLLAGLSGSTSRRSAPRAWALLMLAFAALWLTSLRAAGDHMRSARGEASNGAASCLDETVALVWGRASSRPDGRLVLPHGRCSPGVPALVDDAGAFIEKWRPHRAESLLVEAIRLDPAGVIDRGGGRARVMLALLQRDTGRTRLSEDTMSGLRWNERDAIEALAALEYFSLRRHDAAVESLVLHVVRTSQDKAVVARFMEESRRRRLSHLLPPSPQDVFATDIQGLLANGMVAHARQRLSSPGVGLEPWMRTMLWAKVAAAEGDMARASALAARAVAHSGGADAARWELATLLHAHHRTQEALAEATTLVLRRPEDPGMWLLRAQILLDAGRPEEALRDLEQADELAADPVASVIARSQALRMTGRTREARLILVQALREKPDASWPAWELASWAEVEGRLQEAMHWAREALNRSRGDPGARVLLGRVMAAHGRTHEARYHFELVVNDPRAAPRWREDAKNRLQHIEEDAR